MELTKKLKLAMVEMNIKQVELAKLANTNQGNLSDKMRADNFRINEFEKLVSILNFDTTKHEYMSTKLAGLKFVITGKLNTYTNRDELVTYITNNGGTVQSGVNKDTSYLINNDITSTSGKNKKAKELNIPIISEKQFIDMFVNGTVESVPQTTTQKSTKKKLF